MIDRLSAQVWLPSAFIFGILCGIQFEFHPRFWLPFVSIPLLVMSFVGFKRFSDYYLIVSSIVITVVVGFTWCRLHLTSLQERKFPKTLIGLPIKAEAMPQYNFQTEYGMATVMKDLRCIGTTGNGRLIPRITVYYPNTTGKEFEVGKRAIFWFQVRSVPVSKPVKNPFQHWRTKYQPPFYGVIKDLRLVECGLTSRGPSYPLTKGNSELIAFFLYGRSSGTWVKRLEPYGVGHLLAVSGVHCGLIYLLLRLILIPLRRPLLRSILIVTGISAFSLWMQPTPSVTRATLMIILWEISLLLHFRKSWYTRWWTLLIGSALFSPALILSKGYWYTFAASLGLILGGRPSHPLEHPWLHRIRWVFPLLSAQILVMPLNVMFFGKTHLLSLFWNMLGLVFFLVLILLFLLSLPTLVFPSLCFIPNSLESYFSHLLHSGESIASSFTLYRFPTHPIPVFITLLLMALLLFSKVREFRWYGLLTLLTVFFCFHQPLSGERFVMLDTGQGLSTLLINRRGEAIAFDAGGKLPPGWSLNTLYHLFGVQSLKGIFISHVNRDHYALFSEELKPGMIWTASGQAQALSQIEPFKDREIRTLCKGDNISLDEWKLSVLWPPCRNLKTNNLNDSGLVLHAHSRQVGIMLLGDASQAVEKKLRWIPQDFEILQVGHHGSRTSSQSHFLSLLTPRMALISSGEGNPFHHPHPETIRRLNTLHLPYYETRTRGSLIINLGGSDPSIP